MTAVSFKILLNNNCEVYIVFLGSKDILVPVWNNGRKMFYKVTLDLKTLW
jgi:hypothetical protein